MIYIGDKMKESILDVVFKSRVNKSRFNEYCAFYRLDVDAARNAFKKRGYNISQLYR